MAAEIAVVDARIRTLDPDRPFASALAVQDGVIVAIGDTDEVRAACDGRTTVLSGPGWHVTPGLTDGHQHLVMGAQISQGVNFDRVSSLSEVKALLRAERERIGPDAWIRGFAFEYAVLAGATYHHDLLDEASGPGPMLLHTLDGHTALANGAALRAAGVEGARAFEDGSIIVVDRDGAPTGELRELSAQRTVWDFVPVPTDEQTLAWVSDAIEAQNAVGLTGIHQMDGGHDTIEVFQALSEAGRLNLRIRLHQWVDPSAGPDELAEIIARRDLTGPTWPGNRAVFVDRTAFSP